MDALHAMERWGLPDKIVLRFTRYLVPYLVPHHHGFVLACPSNSEGEISWNWTISELICW